MQNAVRPTLVATATKFGLGAEIQSPTGLFLHTYLQLCYVFKACNVLNDLRKNGQLCDAVIRVEDGHFTVHRAIMSACSPYFRALFTNGMHETDKREV